MNIILYIFLFGFVLTELGITYSRAELQCPNAPVTPYPILAPVSAHPVTPTQTNCCPNQEVNPCYIPPVQCCYNCVTQSCCVSTTSCSNSNVPCCASNTQCSNCGNPCQSSNIQCTSNTQCNNPCHTPPTTCSGGSTNICCQQRPCAETTTTTTTTKKTEITTTESPPDPIIKCPPGTILIGKTCSVLYCRPGHQMVNDHCVVLECPSGTVWIGHKCSVPEPVEHNVTYYNTIITRFNQTKPDIILKNTNNIFVNASVSIDGNESYNINCKNDDDNCDDENATTPSTPNTKCCTVMSPRICENHNNRWKCFSRRSHRCGDFCTATTIYLKAPRVQARPQHIVIPPIQHDCQLNSNCGPLLGGHDCSGCAINNMERCSYYCYRYLCPSPRCQFYDQERYCTNYGGSYGCQEDDGCFDDWCQ